MVTPEWLGTEDTFPLPWLHTEGDGPSPGHLGGLLPTNPNLHPMLAQRSGERLTYHTTGRGLDDDLYVRPFAPHDIEFRIHVPSLPEEANGGDGADLQRSLNNLRAFGYPHTVEVPLREASADALPDILFRLVSRFEQRTLLLRWLPEPAAPVSKALLTALVQGLSTLPKACKERVRIQLQGLPVHVLPPDITGWVDLRVTEDPRWLRLLPTLRARRPANQNLWWDRWLSKRLRDREGYRGRLLDPLGRPTAVVQLRAGSSLHGVIEPTLSERPYLLQGPTHGLLLVGSLDGTPASQKLGPLCRALRTHYSGHVLELAHLRDSLHLLRRSLKPAYDRSGAKLILPT